MFVWVAQSICFSSKLTTPSAPSSARNRGPMNGFRSANSIFDIVGTFKAVIYLTFCWIKLCKCYIGRMILKRILGSAWDCAMDSSCSRIQRQAIVSTAMSFVFLKRKAIFWLSEYPLGSQERLRSTLWFLTGTPVEFRVCTSVYYHTFKWINQPDAAISQVLYYL